MLEKKIEYSYNVDTLNHIQIKRITKILEDGKVISSSIHIEGNYAPGTDIENQSQKVKDLAIIFWTPEVIAAYKEKNAK